MVRVLICLLLTAFFQPILAAQIGGTITGIVINENLDPVPLARVRLATSPVRPMDTSITYGADEQGRFIIPNVEWGTYTLQAMKPDEGYPDTFLVFYRYHVDQPTATVSPAQPFVDVTIPIAKGGRILATVIDAVTGHAVDSAKLTMYLMASTPLSASFPADSPDILATAGIVFEIGVHADGYVDWFYPDLATRSSATHITLKPGERFSFTAKLKPLKPPTENK